MTELVESNAVADSTKVDSTETSLVAQLDSTDVDVDQSQDMAQMMADYPLCAKLRPMADQSGQLAGGPVIGTAYASDTSAVNRYLAIPQVRPCCRGCEVLWGVKPMSGSESVFELYAIKANTRDGKAPLDGGVVVEAREQYAQHGSSAEVSMIMNPSGARTWARLTADNVGGASQSCWMAMYIQLRSFTAKSPEVNHPSPDSLRSTRPATWPTC